MVDGAHAIAHFLFHIPDLQYDYYGASLDKWLAVSLEVEMLYVKKSSMDNTWPILAEGERSLCAIANVGIKGMKPALLAENLLKKYRIYTVAIDGANVHGCRITPNVFTSTADLDVLVNALTEMAQA
jgi:selenocysteine lyase/cysteine desulfurase